MADVRVGTASKFPDLWCHLMDGSIDPVFCITQDDQCLYANQSFSDRVDQPLEEIVGHPIRKFLPSEEADHCIELARLALSCKQAKSYESRTQIRGGEQYFLTTLTPITRDHEEDLCVMAISKDITQYKQTLNILAVSEEKYRALIETTNTGYLIIDSDGKVVDANAEYVRISGHIDFSEIDGRSVLEWTADYEVDKNAAAVARCAQDGYIRNFEIDYVSPSGNVTPVEINATVVGHGEDLRIISLCRDITERRREQAQIHQLAFHDALTQLPNRRLLDDRLLQAMLASKRNGCYGAVMFLDLDNFKPFNDAYGHKAGDMLLIEAATRLKACIREIDTVARFGGDEFVVILSKLSPSKSDSVSLATTVAEKIRHALSEPYLLKVTPEISASALIEHQCTVSIGAALFINHACSLDDILKSADSAMYAAKAAGPNLLRFHDSTS